MSFHVGGRGLGHITRRAQPGGGGAAPAFVGLLTDRLRTPNAGTTANKQSNARMAFTAATDITELAVIYAGYQSGSTGAVEKGITTNTTDTMTVEAAVEYPEGTFTRVTFDAADQGTLKIAPSTGTTASENLLTSDFVEVAIAKGERFWIRTFTDSTVGILYHANPARLSAAGDFHDIAASGLTSLVMGGTISQRVTGTCNGPIAIVGPTDQPSIVLIGDSIDWGYQLTGNGTDFRAGVVGSNLPTGAAHLNVALRGAKSDDWLTLAANGRSFLQYATHAVIGLGINGSGAAQDILDDNLAIAALLPEGCVTYLRTLTPRGASSTDGWTTTAGQTVSGSNATYVAYNALVRAGVEGIAGFIEVRRGALEAEPEDSGLWQNDAGSALTIEGVHPNDAGVAYVGAQGKVPASLWGL